DRWPGWARADRLGDQGGEYPRFFAPASSARVGACIVRCARGHRFRGPGDDERPRWERPPVSCHGNRRSRAIMNVTTWTWLISLGVVAALFVFDFYSHVRTPHAPTMRESAVWSSLYVLLAVLFGLGVWWVSGGTYAGEFFAGYITEKSLSVDNLFVFAIIFARFQVPARYQQKVLLLGIVMALVLRGIFIGVGAAAINAFSWVFYLFGLFLVLTAAKLIHEAMGDGDEAGGPAKIMALVGKVVPST